MPARLRILIAAVVGGGAATLLWSAVTFRTTSPLGALALIGAAFLSGLLLVELASDSAESITYALVAAALVQFGAPAAILAAVAGEAGSALRAPRPPIHRSAYTAGAHAIAAATLGIAFAALGGSPGRLSLSGALIAVAGSLGYFIISSGLVAVAIGWSAGARAMAVWTRSFRWLAPHYPALAVAGVVLALGQRSAGPLGVLVFSLPVLMAHYSVNVFVSRTRAQLTALEDANARLEAMNGGLTEALASVVDARDLYLYRHSHQASAYSERIARRLALREEEIQLVKQAALLHDIGKVGIPEAILRKPGPLDDGERAIMNSHAEIGGEIVARTRELAVVATSVRAHHERFDGRGYPDGLKGKEIPMPARILAVLEAFDAMISDRPYRKALTIADALEEVRRHAGTQFDPAVVSVFLELVEQEGCAWAVNSAGDATAEGADLFLPKALVHDHPHDHAEPEHRTIRLA